MFTEELIEFVLSHVPEIKAAIHDKKSDPYSNIITGGGHTGHSRVPDPTANNAIRNISAVPTVSIPFGPAFNGVRDAKIIRHPEKWVKIAEETQAYYMKNERLKEFYRHRYLLCENWSTTCKELKISRGVYFAMKADVVRMASNIAIGYGVLSPYWLM